QVVGGSADLIKTGDGTLLLTGTRANTATGQVFVNGGTLALGKTPGLKAVGGNITIGDDAGGNSVDVLRLDSSNQLPDTLSILINSSGLFDLNNNDETIGPLTLKAGEIESGNGTLTLTTDVTTQTFTGDASLIGGNLSLGSTTRTFTVARDSANIDD